MKAEKNANSHLPIFRLRASLFRNTPSVVVTQILTERVLYVLSGVRSDADKVASSKKYYTTRMNTFLLRRLAAWCLVPASSSSSDSLWSHMANFYA